MPDQFRGQLRVPKAERPHFPEGKEVVHHPDPVPTTSQLHTTRKKFPENSKPGRGPMALLSSTPCWEALCDTSVRHMEMT